MRNVHGPIHRLTHGIGDLYVEVPVLQGGDFGFRGVVEFYPLRELLRDAGRKHDFADTHRGGLSLRDERICEVAGGAEARLLGGFPIITEPALVATRLPRRCKFISRGGSVVLGDMPSSRSNPGESPERTGVYSRTANDIYNRT